MRLLGRFTCWHPCTFLAGFAALVSLFIANVWGTTQYPGANIAGYEGDYPDTHGWPLEYMVRCNTDQPDFWRGADSHWPFDETPVIEFRPWALVIDLAVATLAVTTVVLVTQSSLARRRYLGSERHSGGV